MPEQCENCDAKIGKLETPCLHNEQVVCHRCKQILAAQEPRRSSFTDPEANARAGRIIARVVLWIVGAVALVAIFQAISSR